MDDKETSFLSTIITFTGLVFFDGYGCVWSLLFCAQCNVHTALIFMCIIQSFGYALINDYSYYLMMRL